MTVNELKAALKRKDYGHLFLFCGEEDYLKHHYLDELRHALIVDDTLAVFNHVRFEGPQIDIPALRDAIETPPMMADYKLIEWHLPNIDRMKDEEIEELCAFAERLPEVGWATVVIYVDNDAFDVGVLPKRPSRRYKQLSDAMTVVHFPTQEDAMLSTWIGRHFARATLQFDDRVPRLLLERAGASMNTLVLEIDKLVCHALANGRDTVTTADVETITSVTTGDDAFGLANALLARQGEAAYQQLNDLRRRRVEPTMLLGSVARIYSEMLAVCELRDEGRTPVDIAKKLRMHEYRLSVTLRALQGRRAEDLRRALSACRELDLAAKGDGGIDTFTGIERLIAETCRT